MIKKLARFALFILCFPMVGMAQVDLQDTYVPLRCAGPIPEDFLLKSNTKIDADSLSLTRQDHGSARKIKRNFVIESNFQIDALLQSGDVLFNDPISTFINQVADIVLAEDPELRKQLRFYTIRSADANAFSTNQGLIFFTTGLIARLENEAQLAFVMCHEIAHFEEKHAINSYVHQEDVVKEQRYQSVAKLVERLSDYSQDLELEADELGLQRFLKSDYALSASQSLLDLFKTIEMPHTAAPFDFTMFESEEYKLRKSLFHDVGRYVESNSIEGNDDDDEDDADDKSVQTHPSVDERKENIATQLEAAGKADEGKEHIVGKAAFEQVRSAARFELSEIYVNNQQFVKALYNDGSLLKTYPNNKYLHKNIVMALYGICKYREAEAYMDITPTYKDVDPELQRLHRVFENVPLKDVYVLALRKAWQVRAAQPDEYLNLVNQDLVFNLYNIHKIGIFQFIDAEIEMATIAVFEDTSAAVIPNALIIPTLADSVDSIDGIDSAFTPSASDSLETPITTEIIADSVPEVDLSQLSKYERLRLERERVSLEKEETANAVQEVESLTNEASKTITEQIVVERNVTPYYLFAFKDICTASEDFEEYYRATELKTAEDRSAVSVRSSNQDEEDSKRTKPMKRQTDRGEAIVALGIDTLLLIAPYYLDVDLRKRKPILWQESGKKQDYYGTTLAEVSAKADLNLQVFDGIHFTDEQATKFNELALMKRCLSESFTHNSNEVDMVNSNQPNAALLSQKYSTQYFAFTGVVSFATAREYRQQAMLLSFYTVVGIPFAIYYALTPERNYFAYFALIDLETGILKYEKDMMVANKDRKTYLKSFYYDVFNQMQAD
jgi:hypothetical protein